MVGNAINDLRIHNHRTKGNEIGNKLADFNTTKVNWKSSLLVKHNVVQLEQNRQRVLVNFLVQPMANIIQNFKGKTNNLFRLGFQKEF